MENAITLTKNKYFIYCRKSSDERSEKQTLSNPAQEQELKDKVLREKLDCVNFNSPYKEERSAFSPGRPLFNELLQRVERNEANAVIVWEISRLSRNPLDTGNLRWLMESGKLTEIRTVNKIYTELDSFLMDIELATSNKESKDTSRRTKRNMLYKVREKHEWSGWAPLGYLNINENKVISGKSYDEARQKLIVQQAKKQNRQIRRIEIDPILGPLMKKMFDSFSTGLYSLNTVAELARGWGLTSVYGKQVAVSTVDRVLSNPFYYGQMKYNGEFFEGNHEPLINKSLFDKIQEIKHKRNKPLMKRLDLTYGGMIKCGECGCAVCGEIKKKKFELYRCTLKRQGYKCSQRHATNKKKIDAQLSEKVKELTINEMLYELLMANIREKNNEEKRIHINGFDHWQRVEKHCEERINRLLDALSEGMIEKEEFLNKKNEIMAEKINAKDKIKFHKGSIGAWHDYAENLIIRASHIYEVFSEGDNEDKKALLMAIGENYRLKDGLVTFDLKPPFNFVKAINEVGSSSSRLLRW